MRVLSGASARVITVALWILASCTDLLGPGPAPGLELGLSEVSVVTGEAIGPGHYQVFVIPLTLTRNGVQGPITVRTEPDIGGLTADTGATFVGAIQLWVWSNGTTIGDHEIQVIATGGGRSVSRQFVLRVLAFRLALVSRRVVLSQGATQRVSVRLLTSGPGTSLQVSGLPQGVTSAFPVSLGSRTLELTAAADVPPQTAQVSVQATAANLSETRTFELVVQPPQPKRPIAFRLCWARYTPPGPTASSSTLRLSGGPSAMAYANDGESWTSITPDADDVIRIDATERVSLAFEQDAYFSANLYDRTTLVRVIHATATELEQMQCERAGGSKSFRLKLENAERYTASLGAFIAASPAFSPGSTGSAAAGPLDLIAAGLRTVGSVTQRLVVVRRGVDLAASDTIRVDFAGAEAAALDSSTYDVPDGTVANVVTRLHTATTVGSLAGAHVQGPMEWYWSVPEALLAPSDMQSVRITTNSSQATTLGLTHYFRTATPLSVAFGPAVATPTVDTATGTITLPAQAEYPDLAGVSQRYLMDGRGIKTDVEVWQTKGYAGGTPIAWTFSPPDWPEQWGRPWIVQDASAAAASTHGASPAVFFGASPPAGTRVTWSITNRGFMATSLPFPTDR